MATPRLWLHFILLTLSSILIIQIAVANDVAASIDSYDRREGRWLEASGKAEIFYGDVAAAKVRAIRKAIENASIQVNARVHSSQVLENGALTVDQLRINSAARVQNLIVIDETQEAGFVEVTIGALVSESQVCATHIANSFRKTVAITGFAMQVPEQSTLGHLGAVDRKLASTIVGGLNGLAGIQALDANYMMLYPSADNAPTSFSSASTLTKAVEAARQLGVQFVVSGIVRDLAISDPDAPYSKKTDKWLKKVGIKKAKRNRHFVLDLYVHDGYSGALVFQSRYSAQGLWNVKHHEKVGFATARFWSTDYGQQVKSLVNQTIFDLQQNIQCQPFLAEISEVKGKRIYVASGAASGLRPGDSLSVYRTTKFFDRSQNEFTQLNDTKLIATIKTVQPHFSVAELPVRVEQLNLQQGDLVIIW